MRTAENWYDILVKCQVKPLIAFTWSKVFFDTIHGDTFSSGYSDLRDFLGQILVESAHLTQLTENLYYSAPRLMVVWPSRFPTLESALPYANNPSKLAEKVYGGRMGNDLPGDGARYPGAGLIMITGKDGYRFAGDLVGQDLVGIPSLMVQPHFALEIAIAWWEKKIPDSMLHDIPRVTRIVNGGLIGLLDRTNLTNLAGEALA